jgi:hypothetical protein
MVNINIKSFDKEVLKKAAGQTRTKTDQKTFDEDNNKKLTDNVPPPSQCTTDYTY